MGFGTSPFSFCRPDGSCELIRMQTPANHPPKITLHRYLDVARDKGLAAGLDDVFFQSSNTQIFASLDARDKLRARWLGRYIGSYPQWTYVALTADGRVAGYLAGCLDDPARTPLFSDNAHFAIFRDLTAQFPAHLHVNLAADYRGGGIGSALVERFCGDAREADARGVHVITGRGARNVGFYAHNGFVERGVTGEGAAEVVFLGRAL